MKKQIIYVGIDVDDVQYHIAGLDPDTGEVLEVRCKPNSGALMETLKKLSEKERELRVCYEASYLGFSLCRKIREQGYECEVVAPSLIPKVAGNRVKTDRLDAEKLAIYYCKGLLTLVHVPSAREENIRDLLRSRAFVVRQLTQIKAHVLSLCRRTNLHYKESGLTLRGHYWSQTHRRWLRQKVVELEKEAVSLNLQLLIGQLESTERTLGQYEEQIRMISEQPMYARRVEALGCFRGIDWLSAMTLICEIGDVHRFIHPKALTSYAGMDIAEHSSGGEEKKGRITGLGNRQIRTTVVEACQLAQLPPKIGPALNQRRKKADTQSIAIADRCMHRLYLKSTRLMYRGKHRNKVTMACARELLSFVWESLRQAA